MIRFSEIPYLRPDMDALEREMSAGAAALRDAPSFEAAYFALLGLEAPRRRFQTLAALCEARNTMDTNDPRWAAEAAWFDAARPRWEALETALGAALTGSRFRKELEPHLGRELFRRAEMTGKAFSGAILSDLAEENRLSARYSALTANLTAEDGGRRLTLGDISRMENRGDRASRKWADGLRQAAFGEAAEELDTLFGELVRVRSGIARKLGFSSFTDAGYCRQGRTGYTREDVAAFRREIETCVTPAADALYRRQRERLGYGTLFAYDEEADFPGAAQRALPGRAEELFEPVFSALSPETRMFFGELRRSGFCDLDDRKGKIRGAYSNAFPVYGLPFIFETYDGTFGAVKTFAHECGHGLHSYLKRGEPFVDNCSAASDLSEIHSMSMEFFIWPQLGRLLPAEAVPQYKAFHLKSALAFLPYGAAVDEFQTRVYDQPEMTPAGRRALWRSLEARYLPWRRYDGEGFLSEGRAWQRQTHIYKWPFYYIDYVLAQTCALLYHFMDAEDHEKAWESYLELLRVSDRCSFGEALSAAGLPSPFAPGTVSGIGQKAADSLKELFGGIG